MRLCGASAPASASPVTCAGEDPGLEEPGPQQVRAEVCVASPRVRVGGVRELGEPGAARAAGLQLDLVSEEHPRG